MSVALPQNFCSEAVCYSEMMTRKIERNQAGRDYKSFTVQVKPGASRGGGAMTWVVNVTTATQRAQGGGLSCQSFTVAPPSLRFSVALLLFLLCLHLHPLSLLFFSSLPSASSASP